MVVQSTWGFQIYVHVYIHIYICIRSLSLCLYSLYTCICFIYNKKKRSICWVVNHNPWSIRSWIPTATLQQSSLLLVPPQVGLWSAGIHAAGTPIKHERAWRSPHGRNVGWNTHTRLSWINLIGFNCILARYWWTIIIYIIYIYIYIVYIWYIYSGKELQATL